MKQNARDRFPREFYTISVAGFLFNLTPYITQPILSLRGLELGASLLQLGLILAIQNISVALLRIPLTIAAQKIGDGRVILICFSARSITYLLYYVAPSYQWFFFIPLCDVVATALFFPLTLSLVSNMIPRTRQGDAMGQAQMIMWMGMFIGPLITSALVVVIGLREVFLYAAPFPVAGMILFLLSSRRKSADDSRNKPEFHLSLILGSLKILLRDRTIAILSTVRTFYFISNAIFMALFSVHAVEHLMLSPSLVALLFSTQGFVNSFIKFPAGRLADSFGRERMLVLTYAIIILDYVGIAYVNDLSGLFVLLAVFGGCWGTRAVVEWSLLTTLVRRETKSMSVSYLENFSFVGSTLGSALAGLAASVMPFSSIFLLAALVNVPALLCASFMKKTQA